MAGDEVVILLGDVGEGDVEDLAVVGGFDSYIEMCATFSRLGWRRSLTRSYRGPASPIRLPSGSLKCPKTNPPPGLSTGPITLLPPRLSAILPQGLSPPRSRSVLRPGISFLLLGFAGDKFHFATKVTKAQVIYGCCGLYLERIPILQGISRSPSLIAIFDSLAGGVYH